MKGKTRLLYDAVLHRIQQVYRQHVNGQEFAVYLMISDFEAAILGAMQSAFPNGRSRGCWFHYGQVRQLK